MGTVVGVSEKRERKFCCNSGGVITNQAINMDKSLNMLSLTTGGLPKGFDPLEPATLGKKPGWKEQLGLAGNGDPDVEEPGFVHIDDIQYIQPTGAPGLTDAGSDTRELTTDAVAENAIDVSTPVAEAQRVVNNELF